MEKIFDVRYGVRYNGSKKKGDMAMTSITITDARKNLYKLVDSVNQSFAPVTITNMRGKNAVLISEEDWKAIEETLYLNSVPGMAESIIEAGKMPIEECSVYDPNEEW